MTEDVHYLNSVQAGRLLGLAPKTLARYRCTGPGPVFCRFRKVKVSKVVVGA